MKRILILCGSVTGASHSVAFALKDTLDKNYFIHVSRQPKEESINDTQWDALILVSSTTGMGELPLEMAEFAYQCRETYPLLNQKPYAIIGLGNSYYESFCASADLLDELMQELQGKRLCDALKIDACEFSQAVDALPDWFNNTLQPSLQTL